MKIGDNMILNQNHDSPLKINVNNVLKFKGFQGDIKGRSAVKINYIYNKKNNNDL